MKILRAIGSLFRVPLAMANGVSAAGGYLLFPGGIEPTGIWAAFIGVGLLAAGGSALNQVLERDLDLIMERTKLRPLPSGLMKPSVASALAGVSISSGLLILLGAGGTAPTLIGITSLVWYLGMYTPLKRRTRFALPVGAVCGALPPVIGWCIAGGSAADYRALLLAGLLYLWQIPHFWLIQHRHSEEYARAGIPLFFCPPHRQGIGIHCRLWICALIAAAMLLPTFGLMNRSVGIYFAVLTLPLIITSSRNVSTFSPFLNLFPIVLTLLLCIQKVLPAAP